MWDCHFRVGGAAGSDLQLANCPHGSDNNKCMAASLLMHVTSKASGYFQNVWAWVADHDIDAGGCDGVSTSCSQVSVFCARGILIESQGPTWLYGTASEHSQLYQYQLVGAKNIWMGLMQTETPYYQANPTALSPYKPGVIPATFPQDPEFADCSQSYCIEAYALRILNSSDIFVYGAGFYSFFSDYSLTCNADETCQLRLIETDFTQGLWMYNIATKGSVQVVSPRGGLLPTFQNDTQSGYTTEVVAWLELALTGANLGDNGGSNSSGSGLVFIDPGVWTSASPSVSCYPPCTLVWPPLTLPTTTVITFPPWTTDIVYSSLTTRTFTDGDGSTTSIPAFVMVTAATVLTIPAVTTTEIEVWAVTISTSSSIIYLTSSVEPPPFVITLTPTIGGTTLVAGGTQATLPAVVWSFPTFTFSEVPITETVGGSTTVVGGTTLPPSTTTITPFPYPTVRGTDQDPTLNTHSTHFTIGPPGPICNHGCGTPCRSFCIPGCGLCPPGLGGLGGGGGPPGGSGEDSGGDQGSSSSSECDTTTTSTCQTLCTASATTTSCSETCSDIISCEATGTDVSSTVTPAPAVSITDEPWPTTTEDPGALSSEASVMSSLLASLYGAETTFTAAGSPPPTTASAPPITTSAPTLAIAAYTTCPSAVTESCDFYWVVYGISSWALDTSGCNIDAALYTSTLPGDDLAPYTVPPLGPFSYGDASGCTLSKSLLVGCQPAKTATCHFCFDVATVSNCEQQRSCDSSGYQQYATQRLCW
jgi:glucan 1,3-beta-glucosidase